MNKPDYRPMARYATVGLEFLAMFAVGLAGGVWLDRRAGGGTWWPVIGAGLGLAVAMVRMVTMARQWQRQWREQQERDESADESADGSEPPT